MSPALDTGSATTVASSSVPSTRSSSRQSDHRSRAPADTAFLRPEDAIHGPSPPLRPRLRKSSPLGRSDTVTPATAAATASGAPHGPHKSRRGQSAGKTAWKKLLWVKQSYPDNYTDEATFLDHLQWNPRLRPYEFWSLVADSTIIVQHVCSVVIFVCCFTGIFQERVRPETVVGWATGGTVAGWVWRDLWQGREDGEGEGEGQGGAGGGGAPGEVGGDDRASLDGGVSAPAAFGMPFAEPSAPLRSAPHSRTPSLTSVPGALSPIVPPHPAPDYHPFEPADTTPPPPPTRPVPGSYFSPRMQERLTTAKSALLIYSSLLGLSPILKSLTQSTSSDSIWALSSWLLLLNVFTFDYGAGPESKFPASLSTNAALMASTVLASRLPTTTHVFSLTLFSIEVFGLFPVFRRHLRHHSWTGHLWLTSFLVAGSGAGLSVVISGGGWALGILGAVLGGLVAVLSMGLTSWWLIGLQRFKNEIRGPWDPARPVIRRGWD